MKQIRRTKEPGNKASKQKEQKKLKKNDNKK